MKPEIFVDTSGFYCLLVRRAPHHADAEAILQKAAKSNRRFVTTDYVLDETATLLRARGHGQLIGPFFDVIFASRTCRVAWTDSERFFDARDFMLRHTDKSWSFTDCLSFCVMRELKTRDALTTDIHFRQAGFSPMLT